MKIRLPLQVGTTAFWSLTRCAALSLPAASIFLVSIPIIGGAALIAAFLAIREGAFKLAGGILVVAAVILFAMLLVVVSGVKHLLIAVRERPSDVVIDGEVLRIVGGRHDGRAFALERIDCQLRSQRKVRTRPFGKDVTLEILALTLDGFLVAEAVRPVEQESLRALADTIQTRGGRRGGPLGKAEPAPAPSPSPDKKVKHEILRCPACDAAAVPDDAAAVVCAYCGAQVPMRDDLRQRVHAQRALERDRPQNERLLHRLLEQPSARVIGGVMIGLGIPILAVWPLAGLIAYLQYRRGVLGFVNSLVLAGAAVSAIAALFFIMRATLVNRMALSLVSTRFGAYAPRKEGEPHLCRACLAPLPAPPGQMLVHCAYCDTENILGLDLRSEARTEARQHRSLADELRRRRGERWVWAAAAIVSFGVLASNRWILPASFTPRSDAARCRTGDGAACLREGHVHEAKATGAGSQADKALDWYRRGCDHGSRDNCLAAAKLVHGHDWFVFDQVKGVLQAACDQGDGRACYAVGENDKDPARTAVLYRRGCELGEADACTDLGFAYSMGKGLAVDKGKALELYLRGCEAGSGLGCRDAGWLYEHPAEGVAPDLARAAAMFDKGCALDPKQCANQGAFLARRCQAGEEAACAPAAAAYAKKTTQPDEDEAQFDAVACDKGIADACYGGGVYVDNAGDHVKARALWQKGCDLGQASACNDLGVKWLSGQGGRKDRARAHALFEKACEMKLELGCNNLAGTK